MRRRRRRESIRLFRCRPSRGAETSACHGSDGYTGNGEVVLKQAASSPLRHTVRALLQKKKKRNNKKQKWKNNNTTMQQKRRDAPPPAKKKKSGGEALNCGDVWPKPSVSVAAVLLHLLPHIAIQNKHGAERMCVIAVWHRTDCPRRPTPARPAAPCRRKEREGEEKHTHWTRCSRLEGRKCAEIGIPGRWDAHRRQVRRREMRLRLPVLRVRGRG